MHKKVYNLWKEIGTKYFWGDLLDSRFYIAYLVSKWEDRMVLDIGCGAGVLLYFSNSNLKIGLDLSFDSLKVAKSLKDPNMEVIQADSRFIPLKSDKFSKILASHIISSAILQEDKEGQTKIMKEIKRLSSKNSEIIIAGANRTSKFFKKKYSKKQNQSYIHFSEITKFFKDDFVVNVEGYGSFSKPTMKLFQLIYKIPENIAEFSGIESLVFKILKSKRFLTDGRSYVISCKR